MNVSISPLNLNLVVVVHPRVKVRIVRPSPTPFQWDVTPASVKVSKDQDSLFQSETHADKGRSELISSVLFDQSTPVDQASKPTEQLVSPLRQERCFLTIIQRGFLILTLDFHRVETWRYTST